MTRERIRSLSRGTEVELVVIRPEDAEPNLPVCLALHGRGEGAGMFVDLGVPRMLSSAVNYQGTPPFAVVAVDGGDSYWVARDEDDDPQKMLAEELPTWLEERGLATNPFAVLGISMGGYGAFNYAANLNDPALAAISPALFLELAGGEVPRRVHRREGSGRHGPAAQPRRAVRRADRRLVRRVRPVHRRDARARRPRRSRPWPTSSRATTTRRSGARCCRTRSSSSAHRLG